MTLPGRRRLGALAVAGACALAPLVPAPPVVAAKRPVSNDRYTGTEDTVLRVTAATGVLANDRVRRSVRRLSVVKAPAHGLLVLTRRGGFRYRPAPDWSGRDTFLYRVVDEQGRRSVAMVRIVVRPVDDPTTAVDDVATVDEDGVVTGNVLANDTDVDSPLRILEHQASRAPGSFSIRPSGDWTYAPAADWNGVAVVGYATTTGALATLRITVRPVDDPTQAVPDFATVAAGQSITGNVLSNDIDVDSTLAVVGHVIDGPAYRWGIDPDGSWNYTAHQTETDPFTVTYTTNTGAVGRLTITVAPAPLG